VDLTPTNTLLQLEHRPTELGRIRLGAKAKTDRGKEYPTTLDTWRLTSGSKALLDAAAVLWGGTVHPWTDAPDEGFWELLTESAELRILIPTSLRTVSQAYEYWQGGTCERRCDGSYEQISGGPCLCDPGNRLCDPMTRVSVMLPDVPGLGVWRLDTSGYNAATSIPATIELLKSLSTQPWIPAILRLEQRSKKVREDGKVITHRFAVPVLDLPGLTVGKVVARMGNAEAPHIEAVARQPQPTAAERVAQKAAAITSGPEVQVEVIDADIEATPAGALDATPDPLPGSAIEGNPMPAPDRCEGFSPELGACVRDAGHKGNHANRDKESWPS